jgi:hypothetical protein
MAGPWDKYRTQQPPRDPTFDFKGPQAAAGVGQTVASTSNTQANTQRTRQQIEQANALFEAQKREAEAKAMIAQLQAQQTQAEVESKDPLNQQALQSVSSDAMSKLQTIDRIRNNIDDAWLPAVGFGAETAAQIGGTNARNVQADIGSLKAGGALSEVLKMSQATGKNPFTPMSNSDVELIARNTANLDQGQSPGNFNSNLGNYRNAYTKAYAGAEGLRTLKNEIESQVEKYQRENPGATPAQRQAFRATIEAQAPQIYNQKMSGGLLRRPPRSAPRKSRVIDFNDWGN